MEIVFWILVAFFSSIGVVEFIFAISKMAYKNSNPNPLVLVFAKDGAENLQVQLNYLFTQIDFHCDMAVVDIGVLDNQKEMCIKICNQHNLTFVNCENLTQFLKEREGEKCLNL